MQAKHRFTRRCKGLTNALMCLVWLAAMLSLRSQAQETVTITNGEWTPYQSEKLPHYGFASLIVSEAFAVKGVKVEYRFRPWKRAYQEALSGGVHASMIWSRTKEREPHFWFSDPILTSEAVLFHRQKMTFDWKTYADLEPYVIGGTLGYQYKIEEWKALKIQRTNTDEQNLRKLALGRVDLFPCDKHACYDLLNRKLEPQISDQLTHHPLPYDQTPYTVIFSREKGAEAERFLRLFNAGLAELKATGRYAAILSAQQAGTLSLLSPATPAP